MKQYDIVCGKGYLELNDPSCKGGVRLYPPYRVYPDGKGITIRGADDISIYIPSNSEFYQGDDSMSFEDFVTSLEEGTLCGGSNTTCCEQLIDLIAEIKVLLEQGGGSGGGGCCCCCCNNNHTSMGLVKVYNVDSDGNPTSLVGFDTTDEAILTSHEFKVGIYYVRGAKYPYYLVDGVKEGSEDTDLPSVWLMINS